MTALLQDNFFTLSRLAARSFVDPESSLPTPTALSNKTYPQGILPIGWPTKLQGPLVWTGDDFEADSNDDGQSAAFVYHLTQDEIDEVTCAVRRFQSLNLGGVHEVNRGTFRLPNLYTRLLALRRELFEGKGFFVIRGLHPEEFTDEENCIIALGISSYIQERTMPQKTSGMMIRHVTEFDIEDTTTSDVKYDFHTDLACSVLVMYTTKVASQGSLGNLASTWKIYNELAENRPDVIQTLAERNWHHDLFPRGTGCLTRSLMHLDQDQGQDRVAVNFDRPGILGSERSPRSSNIPPPTGSQIEALDLIQTLAEKHQFTAPNFRGDMRFINNYSVLHARDYLENEKSEFHYIRLWLFQAEPYLEGHGWRVPEGLVSTMEYMEKARNSNVKASWVTEPSPMHACSGGMEKRHMM